MQDLIAFNERERAREMPYFGQELVVKAAAKGTLADAAYKKRARPVSTRRARGGSTRCSPSTGSTRSSRRRRVRPG
jgi:hypothetical protein